MNRCDIRPAANFRFLQGCTRLLALAATLLFLWSLGASMMPAADAHAPAVIDISGIALGERRTVLLPRRDLFIVHRTPEEIAAARADDDAPMPSPQRDVDRVQRAEWLVVEAKPEGGGFYPLEWERRHGVQKGRYGGWWAPFGDQHYDLSGRLREAYRGSNNLPVPDYYFLDDTTLVIE